MCKAIIRVLARDQASTVVLVFNDRACLSLDCLCSDWCSRFACGHRILFTHLHDARVVEDMSTRCTTQVIRRGEQLQTGGAVHPHV